MLEHRMNLDTWNDSEPNDEAYCEKCGNELDWEECIQCHGEGGRDNDQLMEEDPLWYDGVEWERCEECKGTGGWQYCWTCLNKAQQALGRSA